MSREVLVLFSSIGVLNGLFLSLYFIFMTRERKKSDLLLGFLFLALTIRIGKSVLFYFTELNTTFIHIGLVACAAIGPLLFLYIRSVLSESNTIGKNVYVHFIPVVLLFLFSFYMSYREYHSIWIQIIYGILIQWFIYISFSFYWLYKSKINNSLKEDKFWILSVYISVFLVWLAYTTNRFTSYIVGALTFSVLIYFLMLLIFKKIRSGNTKRAERKVSGFKLNDDPFYEKLNQFLLSSSLYMNPDLTMPDLAKELNVSPHFLSQFLNESMKTNFSKLVNYFRVKKVIDEMKKKSNLSVNAIALDCGFNSTSTFYAAFKAITGMTPSQYKKEIETGKELPNL